jgi:hypothetical protein
MAAKLVLRVVDVVLAVLARLLFLLFAYSCGWSLLTKAELDAARWSADDSRPPIEDASALFLHDLDDLDDLDDDDDAKKKRKREKADAELEDRVAAMLRARGSSSTPHLDGVTLDDHLSHVASILKRWRAPRSIVVAGLAHTAFGSEFLPVRAMPFASRRVAEETCGAWAERMMFLYGTASQSKLYRAVMREKEDEEEEEEEDDARKNSPHHHRFEVTNVYTNETMPLTHAEAGFLLMMHAADVASTIFASKKNLRIKTHPTARTYYRGAFAIHALRRAARRFRRVHVRYTGPHTTASAL